MTQCTWNRTWARLLLLGAMGTFLANPSLAGQKAPAPKAPEGYPAGLPYIAGGVHDKDASFPGTIGLKYKDAFEKVAKRYVAKLKAGKWKLDYDKVAGLKGERFIARKAGQVISFTIKPNYGKPKTIVIVTDINFKRR